MSESSRHIRDTLETLLADDLGTYTLKSGQTVPAIWHSNKPVSDDRVVVGLEVIIPKTPSDLGVFGMNFQNAGIDREYQARLVNHSDDSIPEEVIAKIVRAFKDCEVQPFIASSIAPEQYLFTISAQPIFMR